MMILSEGQLGKIAMAKKSVEKTNILEELQANYSLKRKEDFEYGTVHTYCCKFNKKKSRGIFHACINLKWQISMNTFSIQTLLTLLKNATWVFY